MNPANTTEEPTTLNIGEAFAMFVTAVQTLASATTEFRERPGFVSAQRLDNACDAMETALMAAVPAVAAGVEVTRSEVGAWRVRHDIATGGATVGRGA